MSPPVSRSEGSLSFPGAIFVLDRASRHRPAEVLSRRPDTTKATKSQGAVAGLSERDSRCCYNSGMSRSPSAAEIAERVRTGVPGAEEELYERYRRGIAVLLRQMTRTPEDAEDLFQETFRLALTKIRAGELREPERLPQFLNGLARNLARYQYRKQDRRGDESFEAVDPVHLAIPEGQYEALRRQQKAALTRAVLEELPNSRDRELIYRFYIAEDEKNEICSALGLSSLHFNRVIFRAKQRYRELYRKIAGASGETE